MNIIVIEKSNLFLFW